VTLPTLLKALSGAHSAASGDRGRRRRTRQTRQRACGRPTTRYRAALTVSCNAIPRARQDARARSPKIWGWSAAGISSRGLLTRRPTRPWWSPRERRGPLRLLNPRRLRVRLYRGARPARSERPAPKRARARTTAGSGAAPGCDGCGEFSAVTPPSGVRTRRPGTTIWYRERLRTQHLGVGHAFPHEGLS
jgi:hypothetical protein